MDKTEKKRIIRMPVNKAGLVGAFDSRTGTEIDMDVSYLFGLHPSFPSPNKSRWEVIKHYH